MADTRSSKLPFVIGGLVVLVAVAVGAFLWLTRDDAPDRLAITDDTTTTVAAGNDGSGSTATTGGGPIDATTLDGTWTVTAGTGDQATVAGYRVEEVFAAGARRSEAAGRTGKVTGSVTVDAGRVTAAEFEVDTTTLQSDESRRDNRIRTDGLQTDTFPTATFKLRDPLELPALTSGKVAEVEAMGDLTLHGVTKLTTVTLQVKASGEAFIVAGQAPIVMADFDINPPSVPGFVEVDDHGSFEFIVNLTRS